MSSYTRLRYHIVFTTKNRTPYITADIENLVYKALQRRADDIGVKVLALHGIADHVHLILAIPPTLSVAEVIREVKTASTRSIRRLVPHLHLLFEWQAGYGAFTVDPYDMDGVIAYVANQKEHHARHTLMARYEKTSED